MQQQLLVRIALMGAVLPWMDEDTLGATVEEIVDAAELPDEERRALRTRLIAAGHHAREALDQRIDRHIEQFVGHHGSSPEHSAVELADLAHRVTELELLAAKAQKYATAAGRKL